MEHWDLYKPIREKTGETIPFAGKLPEDRIRMVVHVAIINSQDKMLIQKRQSGILVGPNLWDLSAGGSGRAGDSSQMAIERELKEELGLEHSFEKEMPILTTYSPWVFDDIYAIRKDFQLTDLKLQEEEVQAVAWASLEEIFQLMDEGKFMGYGRPLIELLFARLRWREKMKKKDYSFKPKDKEYI